MVPTDDDDDFEATRMGRRSDLAPPAGKSTRRDRAYLIVISGANVGTMYRIEGSEAVVGRGSNATIRIHDDNISRKHARLFLHGEDLRIEDMGSANGTLVNGAAIRDHVLKDGDKVQLGGTTVLKFTYHDELDDQFQQKMYDAALRDGLTRIFNKRYFLDRMESEIAYSRRHGTALSLIMFDVDHFKIINDTNGHMAGDHVLIRLADIAMKTIRTEDVLARYGGEEFAIICRGVPTDKAAVLAERVRKLVQDAQISYEELAIPVTVSLGVASVPTPGIATSTDLILAADAALYDAKRGGRNRVAIRTDAK
jgi:two-component system cell cycle response regulator